MNTKPIITNNGIDLYLRSTSGEKITFTRFKIGDGVVSANQWATLTDLSNPLVSFDAKAISVDTGNYVKISGLFSNDVIQNDFYWRETGLFCEGETSQTFDSNGSTTTFTLTDKPAIVTRATASGNVVTISSYNATTGVVTLASAPASGINTVKIYYPDGNERLYAYANDLNDAGKIKTNSSGISIEQTISFIIQAASTDNLPAIISPSEMYATKAELAAHRHDASNIVSGVLGLSRGGTGVSSKDALLESLGLTTQFFETALGAHDHDATAINSGTLPLNRGGTGVTTATALSAVVTYIGDYVGDGEANRKITLDFTPRAVLVICASDEKDVCLATREYQSAFSSLAASSTFIGKTSSEINDMLNESGIGDKYRVVLADNGFYVFYGSGAGDAKTNVNLEKYNYIAIK